MIVQLALALVLTCITVIIHAFGTSAAIARFVRIWQRKAGSPPLIGSAMLTVRMVSTLLALHVIEAGVWAVVYLIAGILPDMETAAYFSMTSYTTVGYGDVTLPSSRRLLGPIEAAVGILMFGWSTGIMVAVLTRMYGERMGRRTERETEGKG
jgi:voltage-gated potassium channel